MNKPLLTLVMVAAFTLHAPLAALAAKDAVAMTLQQAIRLAVENNLDVRAELYNPAQQEAEIQRNLAIYDPVVSAQAGFMDTTNSASSPFGPDPTRAQSWQLNTQVSRLFPSGATASVGFDNGLFTNNSSTLFNNTWQSGLGVSVTQPLLKNFGRENTEAAITISRLSKAASLERLHDRLLTTVAEVRRQYFTLYNLREQRQVRKVSLGLAQKILAETKSRVDAGVLPAMEILNAEYGVSAREKEVLDAEQAVLDQSDTLGVLLQLHGQGEIEPVDTPRHGAMVVDSDQAIKQALAAPLIRAQKKNLEISKMQSRILDNLTKPDLALVAASTMNGLDANFGRDLEKVGSLSYPAWQLGLNLSYPLGNNAAENAYRQSRLKSDQAAIQIRALEEQVTNTVKAAIRAIDTGAKQMVVAERGVAYAAERLTSFIRKSEVGLATTKEVLEVENDLAQAKSNRIAAVVNYDLAITRLWSVTGELLDQERVRVDEKAADDLYQESTR
jgi:outer membrane protein TolC